MSEIEKFSLFKKAYDIAIVFMEPLKFDPQLKLKFRLLKTPTVPLYCVRLTGICEHEKC